MSEPYSFTANLIWDKAEGTHQQWLDARKHGLGGSDALTAVGRNPYKSPYVLYLEKTGLVESTPIVEGDISNEPSTWGTNLEPYVAEEFSRRTGYYVHDVEAIFQSRDYPFMFATTDRFVDTPDGLTILECKTRTAFSPLTWLTGPVPDYALYQLHHYMIVLGLDRGFVAVLVGGQNFAYYEVQRDEALSNQIIEAERELWDRISTKTPPPIGGTKADGSMLESFYTKVDPDSLVELGQEAEDTLLQYLVLSKQIKTLDVEKNTLENRLKEMLGNHEVGLIDGEPAFKWKRIKSGFRKFNVLNKWKQATGSD